MDEKKINILKNLPRELLFDILLELDMKSLLKLCRTDTYFADWCDKNKDGFWKAKYKHDFEHLGAPVYWKGLWMQGDNLIDVKLTRNKIMNEYDINTLELMNNFKNKGSGKLYNLYKSIHAILKGDISLFEPYYTVQIEKIYTEAPLPFLAYIFDNASNNDKTRIMNLAIRFDRFDLIKHIMDTAGSQALLDHINPKIEAKKEYSLSTIEIAKSFKDLGYNLEENLSKILQGDTPAQVIKYALDQSNIDLEDMYLEMSALKIFRPNNIDYELIDVFRTKGLSDKTISNDGLHAAVSSGNVEAVKYLISLGATLNDYYEHAEGAEEILIEKGYWDMIKFLQDWGYVFKDFGYYKDAKFWKTLSKDEFINFITTFPAILDEIDMKDVVVLDRTKPVLDAGAYIHPIYFKYANNADQLYDLIHRQGLTINNIRPYAYEIANNIVTKRDEDMFRVLIATGLTKNEVHNFIENTEYFIYPIDTYPYFTFDPDIDNAIEFIWNRENAIEERRNMFRVIINWNIENDNDFNDYFTSLIDLMEARDLLQTTEMLNFIINLDNQAEFEEYIEDQFT